MQRPVRLWASQPNMDALTGGLAALAVSMSAVGALAVVRGHPFFVFLCLWMCVASGLFGLALLYRGLFAPVPLVDVEVEWNKAYDELRQRSDKFGREVASSSLSAIENKYSVAHARWEEHARRVPIPRIGHEDPHVWVERLKTHADERVRMFYELAHACECIAGGAEYRRLAVRAYDIIYRTRETKAGYREWMVDNRVEDGAEPLLVVLAYMEIARANAAVSSEGRTPSHGGFWRLAEEWHPHLMQLHEG